MPGSLNVHKFLVVLRASVFLAVNIVSNKSIRCSKRLFLNNCALIWKGVLDILSLINFEAAYQLVTCLQGWVCLTKKPKFLALDNVKDNLKSIEAAQRFLKACYGSGSVVFVTARSLDVLKKLNLDESQCLEIPELEEGEARSLFLHSANWHCFFHIFKNSRCIAKFYLGITQVFQMYHLRCIRWMGLR